MNKEKSLHCLCVGSINLDLFINGLERFAQVGAHATGENFNFNMGGKAANVATITKILSPEHSVGLLSLIAQDHFGLWQIVKNALNQAKIVQDFIEMIEHPKEASYQKLAVVMVNQEGVNNVVVVNGIADQLAAQAIDRSLTAFELLEASNGLVYVNFELLAETLDRIIVLSKEHSLRVVCDPGGMQPNQPLDSLFNHPIFLLKPNVYEAELLTGIPVTDMNSARAAARWLFDNGQFVYVLITHGIHGGYFFDQERIEAHIPIPQIDDMGSRDETGCGDQVMATLISNLLAGKKIEQAAQSAITAGTLQFHKAGIIPITQPELANFKP